MTIYWAYRCASGLSRWLPTRLAYGLGKGIADVYYLCDRAGRRAVASNIERVFTHTGRTCSSAEVRALARRTYRNFACYLVDFFRCDAAVGKQMMPRIQVEQTNHLTDCVDRQAGVILVTAHFGNWELGGAVLAAQGYDVHAVVLPYRSRRIEHLFNHYREGRGIHTLAVEQAPRQLVRMLKEGRMVALLADRDFSGHQHDVCFFGQTASMPRGPAWLSRKTGAPILPGFMVRETDDTFVFRFHPPLWPEEMETEHAIRDRLAAVLETEIAAHPDQWFIFEEFWKPQHGEQQEQRG